MKNLLHYANTSEVATLSSNILELNKSVTIAEDDYFSTTIQIIAQKNSGLIEKINDGYHTEPLQEFDDQRNQDLKAIFLEVEAKAKRRSGPQQESAQRILNVLNRYGLSITRGSYFEESTSIKALVCDLKADNLTQDRAALPDLNGLIANLEHSQNIFDEKTAQFIQTKVDRTKIKPASEIARELKDIINKKLITYIRVMSEVNKEKYQPYAEMLNRVVEETNRRIRDRKATAERKKEVEKTENINQ